MTTKLKCVRCGKHPPGAKRGWREPTLCDVCRSYQRQYWHRKIKDRIVPRPYAERLTAAKRMGRCARCMSPDPARRPGVGRKICAVCLRNKKKATTGGSD